MAQPPRKQKLLERVREVLRLHHYSLRTEEAYTAWIRRFILFQGKRHPAEMAEPEGCFLFRVNLYLSVAEFSGGQAGARRRAALTQKKALIDERSYDQNNRYADEGADPIEFGQILQVVQKKLQQSHA